MRARRASSPVGLGSLLALALLTVLTFPAAGQGGATLPPGPIYLTDTLTVDEGERLFVGPGTSVTGPGNITVWGTLVVNGSAGVPTEFGVPIRILGKGTLEMRQARLWGVNTTALEVRDGSAHLEDVLVEANARGALVGGAARFHAERAVFRDHAGEALYVEERADVTIANATFSGNGRGATVYSAARFHANGSTFTANGQHLVVDLGPWSAPAVDLVLSEDRFLAPTSTAARLPAILLRHDAPLVETEARQTVHMQSNRIEGAPVGLRAEGRGLTLDSRGDTLVGNDVGVSVQLATVRLEGATLGNARDIDGSGRVSLEGVTYLGTTQQPTVGRALVSTWWWVLVGVALVLVVVGIALAPRIVRAKRAPSITLVPQPAPDPAPVPAPAPDLAAPLTSVERRILEDIVANPGTPQRAVADRLGYTRQALHYHVKKLEARGLVLKAVEGRETRCTVPPAVASMLATAATRTGSQEKA